MALPLLAPLVVTAVAAATAGWFGARWWNRLGGGGVARLDEATPDAASAAKRRGTPQTMTWCATCGIYVLPEHMKTCGHDGSHPGA